MFSCQGLQKGRHRKIAFRMGGWDLSGWVSQPLHIARHKEKCCSLFLTVPYSARARFRPKLQSGYMPPNSRLLPNSLYVPPGLWLAQSYYHEGQTPSTHENRRQMRDFFRDPSSNHCPAVTSVYPVGNQQPLWILISSRVHRGR
jgi:hypothetical protein